jgi:hypothetical protein
MLLPDARGAREYSWRKQLRTCCLHANRGSYRRVAIISACCIAATLALLWAMWRITRYGEH